MLWPCGIRYRFPLSFQIFDSLSANSPVLRGLCQTLMMMASFQKSQAREFDSVEMEIEGGTVVGMVLELVRGVWIEGMFVGVFDIMFCGRVPNCIVRRRSSTVGVGSREGSLDG